MNEERKCVQNFCRKPQEKITTFEDNGLTNWTALTLIAENIQTKILQWEEEQVFILSVLVSAFSPLFPVVSSCITSTFSFQLRSKCTPSSRCELE
jgi:hypothetical protein